MIDEQRVFCNRETAPPYHQFFIAAREQLAKTHLALTIGTLSLFGWRVELLRKPNRKLRLPRAPLLCGPAERAWRPFRLSTAAPHTTTIVPAHTYIVRLDPARAPRTQQ